MTDHQIRQAKAQGCLTLGELTEKTGCGSSCGSCLCLAENILLGGETGFLTNPAAASSQEPMQG